MITFPDDALGLVVQKGIMTGKPVLKKILPGSPALPGKRVQSGDEIVMLHDHSGVASSGDTCLKQGVAIMTYDQLMETIRGAGRPLTLTFWRPPKPGQNEQPAWLIAPRREAKEDEDEGIIEVGDLLEDIALIDAADDNDDDDNIAARDTNITNADVANAVKAMEEEAASRSKQTTKKSKEKEERPDESGDAASNPKPPVDIRPPPPPLPLQERLQVAAMAAKATVADFAQQSQSEIDEHIADTKVLLQGFVARTHEKVEQLKEDGKHYMEKARHSHERRAEPRRAFRQINEDVEIERVKEQSRRQVRSITLMHLERFLQRQPDATFEDWIWNLNEDGSGGGGGGALAGEEGKGGQSLIDEKFYSSTSTHLELWNKICVDTRRASRLVSPRDTGSRRKTRRRAELLSPAHRHDAMEIAVVDTSPTISNDMSFDEDLARHVGDLVGAALMGGDLDLEEFDEGIAADGEFT